MKGTEFNTVVEEPETIHEYRTKRIADWTDANWDDFNADWDDFNGDELEFRLSQEMADNSPQQSKNLVHNVTGRKFRY